MKASANSRVVVTRHDFPALFTALHERGYRIMGPTLRDKAIVYDEIDGTEELPAGWTDEQEAGQYKVKRRDDNALFAYNVGPHSWKRFLQLPSRTLWKAQKTDNGFKVEERNEAMPHRPLERFLLLGQHGLRAMHLQRVLFSLSFPSRLRLLR